MIEPTKQQIDAVASEMATRYTAETREETAARFLRAALNVKQPRERADKPKNLIWREDGQADLLGEFSPQELRAIAAEMEERQKMLQAGYVLVNGMWCKTPAQRAAFAIDGTVDAPATVEPVRNIEYSGMSYGQASKEAARIIKNAKSTGEWFDLPERLIQLRMIMRLDSAGKQEAMTRARHGLDALRAL